MTKEDENIPAADQSLEGMINEAFGTVAVNKLDDFKTGEYIHVIGSGVRGELIFQAPGAGDTG